MFMKYKFTSISYRDLYHNYKATPKSGISLATFIRLKPFYISHVTNREMESCVCMICLNSHCIYNAIRNSLRITKMVELPKSLSEYLCKNFYCQKDEKILFHDINCILGVCKQNCKIINLKDNLTKHFSSDDRKASYYVFETKSTTYYNKYGNKKVYNRTTRVNKEASLSELSHLTQCINGYTTSLYEAILQCKLKWKSLNLITEEENYV